MIESGGISRGEIEREGIEGMRRQSRNPNLKRQCQDSPIYEYMSGKI